MNLKAINKKKRTLKEGKLIRFNAWNNWFSNFFSYDEVKAEKAV
jgi:hypothetical protein